ncbi:hypothetical protein BKA62DRAFT_717553 [Auriculariales sp. MPI-PUGE-AT-0066]|nr:hypothetical protein BKA62DRAFT_717553 [Auriculariales sp. MPI-PUGE-AT-0066]
MVDWNDPYILNLSIRAYTLMAHVAAGAYFWEYLVTIKFDWDVLRRARKLTTGTVLYMACRYSGLFVVCLTIALANAFHDLGCKPLVDLQWSSVGFANCIAAGLLYLRVSALSDGRRIIVWGLGLVYAATWAITIWGTYKAIGPAEYIPELYMCASTRGHVTAHNIANIAQFVFDLLCLGAMLWILVRMHRGGTSSLLRFLVQQGVMYFVVILVAYVLDITFSSLGFNEAITLTPSVFRELVTFIASTRMQRGLIEYLENRPVVVSSGATAVVFNRSTTVHTAVEQDSGPAKDPWHYDQSGLGLGDMKRHDTNGDMSV